MSRIYSAYVAHKHSRNISFTKLCETNQSQPRCCGVVALWQACARLGSGFTEYARVLAIHHKFGDRLQAC
jgi:hypothetical protein